MATLLYGGILFGGNLAFFSMELSFLEETLWWFGRETNVKPPFLGRPVKRDTPILRNLKSLHPQAIDLDHGELDLPRH